MACSELVLSTLDANLNGSSTLCRRNLADSLMGTRLVLGLVVALLVTNVAVLCSSASSAAPGEWPPLPCVAVPRLMCESTLLCCLQGNVGMPSGNCYLQQAAGSLRTEAMRRECQGHNEAWPCAGDCTCTGGGIRSLCHPAAGHIQTGCSRSTLSASRWLRLR